MRAAAALLVAVLLAGCARPNAAAECPQDGRSDPSSGTLVHVYTLNDGNSDALLCYRAGGGATHGVGVRHSGSTPNVGRGEDVRAAPGASFEAWMAGAEGVGRATLPIANETWVAIVTQPEGVVVQVFDQPPVFD